MVQGYLGHCLSRQCRISVIGLEREGKRAETAAQKRGVVAESCDRHMMKGLQGDLPGDLSTPQHVSVELSVDGTPQTCELLRGLLDHVSLATCVTGLHCCGDLTPSTLHLLHSLPHPSLRAAVILGCCYHKMALGVCVLYHSV